MQKLYYWIRKSISNEENSLFYDIKLKLNFDYSKAFTQKELEKIENDTFLMDSTIIESLTDDILNNMKVYNSKKSMV